MPSRKITSKNEDTLWCFVKLLSWQRFGGDAENAKTSEVVEMKSGKGNKGKSSISKHDSLRLSALADGELDSKEQDLLTQRIGSDAVAESQASFAFIGDGLREFVQHERLDEQGAERSLAVWEQIESRLEQAGGIGEWLEQLGASVQTGIQLLLRPPALAGIAVALIAVAYVGFQPGQVPEQEPMRMASFVEVDPTDMPQPMLQASPSSIPAVSFVGLGSAASQSTSGMRVVRKSAAQAIPPSKLSYRRFAQRAGAMHTLSGGLRVGGADIEWIRAVSSVEIVPALSQHKPPVIWVGKRVQ